MLDISWGELFVVTGLGMFLIGRKDLPKAFKVGGTQLGRIVGLLQGARARADRFTTQEELRGLSKQLHSGLRELDAVRMELATAATARPSSSLMSSSPSSMSSMSRLSSLQPKTPIAITSGGEGGGGGGSMTQQQPMEAVAVAAGSPSSSSEPQYPSSFSKPALAPRLHAVAAVAEEEWEKQGIGFTSRAEMGNGSGAAAATSSVGGGSVLLADLLQQSLIHDQYDRAVMEQEEALKTKQQQNEDENHEDESNNNNKQQHPL